jgi:hypothetical protein
MSEGLVFEGLSLPVGIFLAALLGSIVVAAYARSLRSQAAARRAALMSLRGCAVVSFVGLCLLPALQHRRLDPIPPRVGLLVDVSPSMRLPSGPGATRSRRELAERLAERLARGGAQLELHSFASELVRGLGARGGSSHLHGAVEELQGKETSASDLKAILVLTDGRATDSPRAASSRPVFAVPLGAPSVSDLGVEADELPSVVEPNLPLEVRGRVFRSDPATAVATVELWSADTLLEERSVQFEGGSDEAQVRFEFVPRQTGLGHYRLAVRAAEPPVERSMDENEVAYLASMAVPSERRILLSASRPGFESAFLGRQLEGESGLKLTRAVGVSAERLVLADGATETDSVLEPLRGFAAVVVVGAGALRRIDRDLADYVRAGGGFVYLPGDDPPEWTTRIEAHAVLPLIDRGVALARGSFPVRPTATRSRHSLMEFLQELSQGAAAFQALPPLRWALTHLEPRSGAEVLLTVLADGREWPLLVVQRYGQGRVAVVSGGPLWSWRFHPAAVGSGKEEAYIRLVPRLIRWAAAGGEFDRFRLGVRGRGAGEPMEVRLSALREDLKPAEGHGIHVEVLRVEPDGRETPAARTDLTLGAGGSATWSPVISEPGVYRVRAVLDDGADAREAAVALNPPAGEMAYASAGVAALERLTQGTGGRLVAAEELPDLLEEIAARDPSLRLEIERSPQWSTSWMLGLCAGLLMGEWLLRRLWSLP